MVSRTISHYTILRKLGGGAMGVVYKAKDVKLKRPVALKLLPRELTDHAESKERFIEEAQAASALDHTNICTVYEIDETPDGQMFMALAYYEGETLKKKILRGPIKVQDAVDIAIQVARGLAKAHEMGIVHRDIKPANLMITRDGMVKIVDFGLAKLAGPAKLTDTRAVVGTAAYMSPEQARGEEVDQRSDVWSLGVVIYQMLTGKLPFKGEYEQAVVYSILSEKPEPIAAVHPDVPAELERIVAKAMAKAREKRYRHAADVLEDLKALKSGIRSGTAISPVPGQVASPGNNLPHPLTSFVGRDIQIADIKRLLGQSRLLTLAGAAGCGKTRLALEVSRDLLQRFHDGIWLVELAPLQDPSLVSQTVAITLGLKEQPNQTVTNTLVDYLKGKNLLLVLDNCEHLIPACAELASALLRACPQLHILATSREGLAITGEVICHVPPLAVPAAEVSLSLTELRQIEAVRLFVERATAARAGFTLTSENAPAIVQICRRLDGIPLALELGAARVGVLPVEEIARRLDDRFGLLANGGKGRIPHHQTLRSLIDWSYDLVSQGEQMLFRRLSVFEGGWTMDAAETVCAGNGIHHREVLDLHSHLVEKSLVEMEPEYEPGKGNRRYRMLGIVHEYARHRLQEEEKGGGVQKQHRDYFLALADESARQLIGPEQRAWTLRLEAEHDNLRAALDSCSKLNSNAQLSLQMAGALGRYWYVRGRWAEGRSLLLQILASPDASDRTKARARALSWAGWLAFWQGDFEQARAVLEESLSIWEEAGESLGIAEALNNLGAVAKHQGDFASARQYHEKSLAIRRRSADQRSIAVSLHNLGEVYLSEGKYARARAALRESLKLFRQVGHTMGVADSLSNLGVAAEYQGDYAEARTCYEEALNNRRDRQEPMGTAESLYNLGQLAARQGEYAQAHSYHAESLAVRKKLGDRMHIADSLEAFGVLAAGNRKPNRAARLLGAARSLRKEINAPVSPAKQEKIDLAISRTRSELGQGAFTKEWDKGQAVSLDQAIDYALKRESQEHAQERE